jgi:hypothetical protein
LDPDLSDYDLNWSDLDRAVAATDSALVAGLILLSDPAGAGVMVDGGSTALTTPDTLTHIATGYHEIRLYLHGYNEHIQTVDYTGGFVTVSAALALPGYPRPVITFASPEDSARFDDNVISITGTVQMEDEGGSRTSFLGDTAVMTLNGADQLLNVSSGWFDTDVSIFTGENAICFRATGTNGNTGVSEPLIVFGDFVPDDIVITLSWNTPTSDIDLHVWNPLNEHCYFANKQITEGFLDIDDVEGYGPETFTATNALNGTYVVKINSYSLDADAYSDASVNIWLNGGAPGHYGPHHFTVADGMGSNPEAWWEVTVFTMADGKKGVRVQSLTPERLAQIEADMRHLPQKE